MGCCRNISLPAFTIVVIRSSDKFTSVPGESSRTDNSWSKAKSTSATICACDIVHYTTPKKIKIWRNLLGITIGFATGQLRTKWHITL